MYLVYYSAKMKIINQVYSNFIFQIKVTTTLICHSIYLLIPNALSIVFHWFIERFTDKLCLLAKELWPMLRYNPLKSHSLSYELIYNTWVFYRTGLLSFTN